ncbi:MAG: type II toxin-antitoxin system RelE/ParE family toxin [Chitinophagales bacterium]
MGIYKNSVEAEFDLSKIYEYGIQYFGIEQAKVYFTGLESILNSLAKNPNLGRIAYEFYPELRRFLYQSHIIFYLPTDYGIFVVRVLHQSVDYNDNL